MYDVGLIPNSSPYTLVTQGYTPCPHHLSGHPYIQVSCSSGEYDACVIVTCWTCSSADLLLGGIHKLQGVWVIVEISASVRAGCEPGAQSAAAPLTLHRQPQSKGVAVGLEDHTGSLCQDFPT